MRKVESIGVIKVEQRNQSGTRRVEWSVASRYYSRQIRSECASNCQEKGSGAQQQRYNHQVFQGQKYREGDIIEREGNEPEVEDEDVVFIVIVNDTKEGEEDSGEWRRMGE